MCGVGQRGWGNGGRASRSSTGDRVGWKVRLRSTCKEHALCLRQLWAYCSLRAVLQSNPSPLLLLLLPLVLLLLLMMPGDRWVDTDVLMAPVRDTSQKPDEMYPLLERLSPGGLA